MSELVVYQCSIVELCAWYLELHGKHKPCSMFRMSLTTSIRRVYSGMMMLMDIVLLALKRGIVEIKCGVYFLAMYLLVIF